MVKVKCLKCGKEIQWSGLNEVFSSDCAFEKIIFCESCYNNPCTCENKGNHLKSCPYDVKRENQLKDKLEYIKNKR